MTKGGGGARAGAWIGITEVEKSAPEALFEIGIAGWEFRSSDGNVWRLWFNRGGAGWGWDLGRV